MNSCFFCRNELGCLLFFNKALIYLDLICTCPKIAGFWQFSNIYELIVELGTL